MRAIEWLEEMFGISVVEMLIVLAILLVLLSIAFGSSKQTNSKLTSHVESIQLDDGTRCVVYRYYGITCDWSAKKAEAPPAAGES